MSDLRLEGGYKAGNRSNNTEAGGRLRQANFLYRRVLFFLSGCTCLGRLRLEVRAQVHDFLADGAAFGDQTQVAPLPEA